MASYLASILAILLWAGTSVIYAVFLNYGEAVPVIIVVAGVGMAAMPMLESIKNVLLEIKDKIR